MLSFNKPLKISVFSFVADLSLSLTTIDILTLALYLDLSPRILGIDLNYLRGVKIIRKGKILNKNNNFYNQLTLVLALNNREERKVKIFTGGKIQVCGCKGSEEIEEIYSHLKEILTNFRVDKEIELFPLGPLIVDEQNFIYNPVKNSIIGAISPCGKLYFHGEEVVAWERNDLFLSVKFDVQKKKYFYDKYGYQIGYLTKDKKTVWSASSSEECEVKEKVFYSLSTEQMCLKNVEIILLNSFYKIEGTIQKEKLKSLLTEKGYYTQYEPLIYHALKVMYFFGEGGDGKCHCDKNEKCSCVKTTSIVSSNGSVLLYGFKSIQQRDIVFYWLNKLIAEIIT